MHVTRMSAQWLERKEPVLRNLPVQVIGSEKCLYGIYSMHAAYVMAVH